MFFGNGMPDGLLVGMYRLFPELPHGEAMLKPITCAAVLLPSLLLAQPNGEAPPSAKVVPVVVDPLTRRRIGGVGELRREVYFGLCDPGSQFDERCGNPERYEYLVRENGITFGRRLGIVHGIDRWYQAIKEDEARPGFADLDHLKDRLAVRLREPGETFRRDMGGKLDVAAHGRTNAYPEFMGVHATESANKGNSPCRLPENVAAAAELAAAVLRHGFTDFDRPAWYELINEPHWSYWRGEHLANWHTATRAAVRRENPEVRVGGPCLSVAYYYRNQFQYFGNLQAFIDQTDCSLDFYSFHVYDFLREKDGDFGGRITGGLPLEGVLDLVQNYTVNAYGREVPLVISEHGGYGADELVDQLARTHFPGDGFDWEMRKRSICDFNMVSSVIANTLAFMDHPHTVHKAVPFILLHAMNWDPNYYAVLYVPRDFTDKTDWVPTRKILFYRLFRDVRGHRVAVSCPDPDVQARAFADGGTLFLVLNNLSNRPKRLAPSLPAPERLTSRRFGRSPDFTPYYREEPATVGEWHLAPRETLVLRADYPRQLVPERTVDEVVCYGDRVAVQVEAGGEAAFRLRVPTGPGLRWASLRIGVSRPPEAGWDLRVALNGKILDVPLEESAERLVEQEYASTKLIALDPADLQTENEVVVSFPDGGPGGVGAVVIRAGVEVP